MDLRSLNFLQYCSPPKSFLCKAFSCYLLFFNLKTSLYHFQLQHKHLKGEKIGYCVAQEAQKTVAWSFIQMDVDENVYVDTYLLPQHFLLEMNQTNNLYLKIWASHQNVCILVIYHANGKVLFWARKIEIVIQNIITTIVDNEKSLKFKFLFLLYCHIQLYTILHQLSIFVLLSFCHYRNVAQFVDTWLDSNWVNVINLRKLVPEILKIVFLRVMAISLVLWF